jgi:hypothetical protein
MAQTIVNRTRLRITLKNMVYGAFDRAEPLPAAFARSNLVDIPGWN